MKTSSKCSATYHLDLLGMKGSRRFYKEPLIIWVISNQLSMDKLEMSRQVYRFQLYNVFSIIR